MRLKLIYFLGLFLISNMLSAQFTFSGQFRPRTEYRHGFGQLANTDQDAQFFTSQRTRFNFDYRTDGYKLFIALQDVRVYGTQRQLVNNDGSFTSVHMAYAAINLNKDFKLSAGRQPISYDDQRIFGYVGWAQQARVHDAFIFKYNKDGFKADAGFAFNINTGAAANYTDLEYLWLHKDFKSVKMSILFLNNGKDYFDTTGDLKEKRYTQTIGTRTGIKQGKFSAFANLYYQGGSQGFVDTKVKANLLGLDLGYNINKEVSVGLGYERQSGNDITSPNDENNAFSPFYGTNHKFNGVMDFFYVGNHFGSVGLQDIFGSIKYKKNKFFIAAAVHQFSSSNTINKDFSDNLGTEVDLGLGFPLAKGVGFSMGYSQMFGSESLEYLRGRGDHKATSNWAWMTINIAPTFFTTKKEETKK